MYTEGFLTDSHQVHLEIDGFPYTVARSLEDGGKNEGPSPHGFLLGSIASCKMIVAKSYLDHNNIAYEKIDVQANSKIKGPKRSETIAIEVKLVVLGANLDEKQLRYMQRIVDKGCTMANILTSGGENTVDTIIETQKKT